MGCGSSRGGSRSSEKRGEQGGLTVKFTTPHSVGATKRRFVGARPLLGQVIAAGALLVAPPFVMTYIDSDGDVVRIADAAAWDAALDDVAAPGFIRIDIAPIDRPAPSPSPSLSPHPHPPAATASAAPSPAHVAPPPSSAALPPSSLRVQVTRPSPTQAPAISPTRPPPPPSTPVVKPSAATPPPHPGTPAAASAAASVAFTVDFDDPKRPKRSAPPQAVGRSRGGSKAKANAKAKGGRAVGAEAREARKPVRRVLDTSTELDVGSTESSAQTSPSATSSGIPTYVAPGRQRAARASAQSSPEASPSPASQPARAAVSPAARALNLSVASDVLNTSGSGAPYNSAASFANFDLDESVQLGAVPPAAGGLSKRRAAKKSRRRSTLSVPSSPSPPSSPDSAAAPSLPSHILSPAERALNLSVASDVVSGAGWGRTTPHNSAATIVEPFHGSVQIDDASPALVGPKEPKAGRAPQLAIPPSPSPPTSARLAFSDDDLDLFASINEEKGAGEGGDGGGDDGVVLAFDDDELDLFEEMAEEEGGGEAEKGGGEDDGTVGFDMDTGPIKWKRGKLLGQGAFGKVYLGLDLEALRPMAVKVIEFGAGAGGESAKAEAEMRAVASEVDLLRRLKHDNIVEYYGASSEVDEVGTPVLFVFLEFVGNGSLETLLQQHVNADGSRGLDEETTRAYMYQILQGLLHLHDNMVAHRDIKAGNVLVSKQPSFPALHTMLLADFGASATLSTTMAPNARGRTLTGTPNFMAPEVVKQSGHGLKADIWSIGCLAIELLTGRPPWPDSEPMAIMFAVAQHGRHPPLPEDVSAECKAWLLRCFEIEPKRRATAAELLRHPWFATLAQLPPDSLDATAVAAIDIDDVAAEIDALVRATRLGSNAKASFSYAAAAKSHTKINTYDDRPISTPKSVEAYFERLLDAESDPSAVAALEREFEAPDAQSPTE